MNTGGACPGVHQTKPGERCTDTWLSWDERSAREMLDIHICASFSWHSFSRCTFLRYTNQMRLICIVTSKEVLFCQVKINHMLATNAVRLFLNSAWIQTLTINALLMVDKRTTRWYFFILISGVTSDLRKDP